MSHLITKITSKIILAFLVGTFLLSAVFLITDYISGMSHAAQSGREKLSTAAHAMAPMPDLLMRFESRVGDSTAAEKHIVATTSEYLSRADESFGSDIRTSLLFFDHNGDPIHFATAHGTAHTKEEAALIATYQAHENHEGFLPRTNTDAPGVLRYAASVEVSGGRIARAVLFTETDISTARSTALKQFYGKLFGAFCILALLVIFVKNMLKRIFSHETLSKKKLSEYAAVAAKRNAELETLSFVLGKSANLIVLTDRDGKIEWINESSRRRNNYSVEELDSFRGRELAEVSQYPRINEVIEEVKLTGRKIEYEAKSYDADKNEFWASTTVTPVRNEEGVIDKILFIDADITKLKQAEAEIKKLADITRENTSPVIRIASDSTVSYANSAGEMILTLWQTGLGQKVTNTAVINALAASFESSEEKVINIACEQRIFSLRFIPFPEKGYANIYGDDITEAKTARTAGLDKVARMEKYNLNITDSINYARRIQESILPGEDQIRKYFKDSFALIMPKDIVSGDFFWIHELIPEREYLVALADCTGHGVPGAMMSIIGHSLLNEIVEAHGFTDPPKVLRLLNREVIKTLRQKQGTDSAADGMDIALIHINLNTMKIRFSGAYRPVYRMNGVLEIFKGDRQPIGGMHHEGERDFRGMDFDIAKGDSIYLMSDGFTDQFGGPNDKKFLSHRVKSLIEDNHKYSMQAQSFIFRKTFESWKGIGEQIDDVSVIGIKF